MTHWKKLEVYRPLQAEEISPSFKKFAHDIADELLKENNKRYQQEIEKLNQKSVDYLNSFQKKKSK
ncbi:hypothetical protein [Pedobacter sp. UYP1]|jgi:DNA primase|uniref:hypothetical protein n=1 Tax=Pedobacter sp. UYP1 TaxID=1756396 RepID=UPI0033983148